MTLACFHDAISRWDLLPDGAPMTTASAALLPVRWQGRSAMLKVAREAEEQRGYALLAWWGGAGAAQVYAWEGSALVMERAQGAQSLAALSHSGQDGAACRIVCTALGHLHQPRATPAPDTLVPLTEWFHALQTAAAHCDLLRQAQSTAAVLLAQPRDVLPLHGDIHHGNVLDFGERGWLAVDPKGLWGERGFDYANLFCNPDAATAGDAALFAARLDQVSQQAALEPRRLLQWIVAWAGLSAVWHQESGTDAAAALQAAQRAASCLAVSG